MLRNLLSFAALIAVFAAPAFVSAAEDAAPQTSYSLKKQGRVPFENKSDEAEEAAGDAAAQEEPADIEPAAGAEDATKQQNNALSESMKLPRKN